MLQGSPNEGKNAFHFLMESRNKIIGQNTSGKDLNLVNCEDLEQKQKLAQRRSILQEWADDKGASKRKREDEEKEACIKVKMKKRAKRLKNMLENLDNDDDFQRKPRKKRVKRIISSESENSKDGYVNLENNQKKIKENEELLQKLEDNIVENNSTETQNNKELNNDVINNGRILRPRHKKTTFDSPNSCKNGWKMKIKPPKSEKTSNSDSEVTISSKTSKKHSKKQQKLEIIVSSGSDNDEYNEKSKSVKKLAPIFVSKPKIDPEVMEARRKFLLSGIPSTLKKVMEKQKSVENREFDLFPKISHVQQKSDLHAWNLPKAELKTTENSELQIEPDKLICSGLICRKNISLITKNGAVQNMDTLKNTIKYIKSTNPDYPVFKSFRHIYKKCKKYNCGKNEEKTKSDEMWSEKYKPSCSEEFLGNHKGINALKTWLETWKNYSEEINSKRKRRDSNSESEFEGTDSDSRDSVIKNTVVLGGPSGSGKTAAVYAICNELGINILELNASSKRTGKKLVQELQEATQSHQVRKRDSGSKCFKKDTNKSKQHHKKLCVLLVEDVDVVFEQDDGFVSALTQLTFTSKRPIILTTTDDAVVVTQKYLSQYDFIQFAPFSSSTLSVWLQIVCISEGLLVNKNDISSLLEYHKGDARRTLLQLQFWVNSEQKNVISPARKSLDGLGNEKEEEMELLECPDFKVEETNVEIFQGYRDYDVPYEFNLGLLWWNVPNLLRMPSMCKSRLTSDDTSSKIDSNDIEKNKLNSLSRFYDALAFADVSLKKFDHYDGNEPEVFSWSGNVKDSLELFDHSESYNDHIDFVRDFSHTLINDCIGAYNEGESKGLWDMAVPGPEERRWRYKIHSCENFLQEALTLSSNIERKSIALDYMPALRNIARTEEQRAASNTKRGNRFRNYLKNLNISFNDNMCKLACNILQLDE